MRKAIKIIFGISIIFIIFMSGMMTGTYSTSNEIMKDVDSLIVVMAKQKNDAVKSAKRDTEYYYKHSMTIYGLLEGYYIKREMIDSIYHSLR